MNTYRKLATIVIIICFGWVNGFSKDYYEKRGFHFDSNDKFLSIGGGRVLDAPSAAAKDVTSRLNKNESPSKNPYCDPDHLEINVFNDHKCDELNVEVTEKVQLSDKQKQNFESCQTLFHGSRLFGMVNCEPD